MTTQRRDGRVSPLVPRSKRGGSWPRLWAYGYSDLARLVGKSEDAVRHDVQRGRLDPADLASVVAYVNEAGVRATRREAKAQRCLRQAGG
jgi:hypothetical protein